MATSLGKLETQLFGYVQMRRKPTIQSEEVVKTLGITPIQTRKLLSRLARRHLIARVRRGLYLVPLRIPPGGRWSPSEYSALSTLIEDRGGCYQICGPSAFHRYGWDEQVPNRVYAYNNRLSGERQIGIVSLSLIKTRDARLGGTESMTTPDGIKVFYSSRARSLVDAIYDWSRFGSLPRAYQWIREELKENRITPAELASSAIKYGNISTLRRIGKLLEMEGAEPKLLKRLQRKIPKTTALIPWSPTQAKRGKVDQNWGIIFNE